MRNIANWVSVYGRVWSKSTLNASVSWLNKIQLKQIKSNGKSTMGDWAHHPSTIRCLAAVSSEYMCTSMLQGGYQLLLGKKDAFPNDCFGSKNKLACSLSYLWFFPCWGAPQGFVYCSDVVAVALKVCFVNVLHNVSVSTSETQSWLTALVWDPPATQHIETYWSGTTVVPSPLLARPKPELSVPF